MHSKSGNTEIMINDEADEVIKDFFDSLKNMSSIMFSCCIINVIR